MLEGLINVLGKSRRGKSLEQLQDRLGWTKIQLRNALSRAGAKGLVEQVGPGVYRQTLRGDRARKW
jgi:predicted transcriptional regulator of viral defense system